MSNVCAGIGSGQMTVLDSHIAHHRHVQRTRWVQSVDARFDANFLALCCNIGPGCAYLGAGGCL